MKQIEKLEKKQIDMKNLDLHTPPLIHIGFPKSLSSWMQKKLFIEAHGYQTVLNPLTAKITLINPPPFRFNKEDVWKTIRQNAINERLVPVITAENLCGNLLSGGHDSQINAERIKQAFPEAKIVIVIREQAKLIRSLYKTQVNWGMPYTIEELISRRPPTLIPEFTIEMLRFDGIIRYYQHLYSNNNVLVLPYELFIENPEKFCLEIAEFSDNKSFNPGDINYNQIINGNRPLIDIYFDRYKNRLMKNPFNYNGLIIETEQRLNNRIKLSKKSNRFPRFMKNWFEDSFKRKTNELLSGQFCESNRTTQYLIQRDLTQYGYQL